MKKIIQHLLRGGLKCQKSALILVVVLVCGLVIGKLLMIDRAGPTWRGITVGRSSVDDVIAALGAPASVEQESERLVYKYHEGRWGEHRVVFHNGIVEYLVEDALAYPYDTFLMQLVEQYGLPNHIMWSHVDPSMRIAIFSDDGVFASATFLPPDEAIVEYISYYRPCSLARLLVDFKDEISVTNPFPDSDVIGPRDPWFGKP